MVEKVGVGGRKSNFIQAREPRIFPKDPARKKEIESCGAGKQTEAETKYTYTSSITRVSSSSDASFLLRYFFFHLCFFFLSFPFHYLSNLSKLSLSLFNIIINSSASASGSLFSKTVTKTFHFLSYLFFPCYFFSPSSTFLTHLQFPFSCLTSVFKTILTNSSLCSSFHLSLHNFILS